MEFRFDREQNLRERLWFVHLYASWVKRVPNKVWSAQQAMLINSLLANTKEYPLTREQYLAMKAAGAKQRKIPGKK